MPETGEEAGMRGDASGRIRAENGAAREFRIGAPPPSRGNSEGGCLRGVREGAPYFLPAFFFFSGAHEPIQ